MSLSVYQQILLSKSSSKRQLLCQCFKTLIVCSNTTLLKLQTVLFLFFFQILRFQIGGAAYLWMRLIHGGLRYSVFLKLSV